MTYAGIRPQVQKGEALEVVPPLALLYCRWFVIVPFPRLPRSISYDRTWNVERPTLGWYKLDRSRQWRWRRCRPQCRAGRLDVGPGTRYQTLCISSSVLLILAFSRTDGPGGKDRRARRYSAHRPEKRTFSWTHFGKPLGCDPLTPFVFRSSPLSSLGAETNALAHKEPRRPMGRQGRPIRVESLQAGE